jgi:hypothetical protein
MNSNGITVKLYQLMRHLWGEQGVNNGAIFFVEENASCIFVWILGGI